MKDYSPLKHVITLTAAVTAMWIGTSCSTIMEAIRDADLPDIITEPVTPPDAPEPQPLPVPEPGQPSEPDKPGEPQPSTGTDPITITSWGAAPAPNAKLDPSAVLSVSEDGKRWRWVNDPGWPGYKFASGREFFAACYIAVQDGRGGWKAGKFDHWPRNLVDRDRKNILPRPDGSTYAGVPVPKSGDTVYWFAVEDGLRRRSNLVKGRW